MKTITKTLYVNDYLFSLLKEESNSINDMSFHKTERYINEIQVCWKEDRRIEISETQLEEACVAIGWNHRCGAYIELRNKLFGA